MRGRDAWFTTFNSQWEWVALVGRGACVCWDPLLRVRGDRRNTQLKRRSECISRNFSASRGRRFVSWTARKNLAVLRAGHAAFDWSESGPSFHHQKGRDPPWLSLVVVVRAGSAATRSTVTRSHHVIPQLAAHFALADGGCLRECC